MGQKEELQTYLELLQTGVATNNTRSRDQQNELLKELNECLKARDADQFSRVEALLLRLARQVFNEPSTSEHITNCLLMAKRLAAEQEVAARPLHSVSSIRLQLLQDLEEAATGVEEAMAANAALNVPAVRNLLDLVRKWVEAGTVDLSEEDPDFLDDDPGLSI